MTYELAKKLKEVGFPFTEKVYDLVCQKTTEGHSHNLHVKGCDLQFTPSLSELIDACGRKFHSLVQHEDGSWLAYTHIQGNKSSWEEGDTLLIAVANLYLALNKK